MPEINNVNRRQSHHNFVWPEVVSCLEFFPQVTCQNLLAIGGQSRVSILSVTFQQEGKDDSWLEVDTIREFHHGYRVVSIAWSVATSLSVLPKCVRFCTAGADKKIRCFSSDLKSEDTVRIIDGHTDYVNDVTFEPEKGDQIASVSDDLTCRIFDSLDGSQKVLFSLGSPGMSVCWHSEDPMKLMVGEKNGIIRFYNLLTQQPIMSLDCGHGPLLSADWCLGNTLSVAAVSGSDFYVFDTSISWPTETKQAHAEGGRLVKWSRTHPYIVATLGKPGSTFTVHNIKLNQTPVSVSDTLLNGITWHCSFPMVAVGADKKISLWNVDGF